MSDMRPVDSSGKSSYNINTGESSSMEKMVAKQHYSHPAMVDSLVQGLANSIKMDNQMQQQTEQNVKKAYKKGAN